MAGSRTRWQASSQDPANLGGVGGDLVRKLLPILAPIVMSYLAKKILGGQNAGGGAGDVAGRDGSGDSAGQPGGIDLGSILGGILGGGPQGGAGAPGGGFGDILGGILGGGSQGGQQSRGAVVPERAGNSAPQAPTGPLGQPIPQGGAPVPGELIDVDLPDDGTAGHAGGEEERRRRPRRPVGRALREEIAALDSAQSSAQGWPESSGARTVAAAAAATWASHSSSSRGLRNAITGGMSGLDCHSLNTRFFLAKELKCQ